MQLSHPAAHMHRVIVNICKSNESDVVYTPSFGVSINENGNDAGRSAGNRPGCFICHPAIIYLAGAVPSSR